jgi:hypothetical protein
VGGLLGSASRGVTFALAAWLTRAVTSSRGQHFLILPYDL